MIKRLIVLVLFAFGTRELAAQNVYQHYTDGRIYIKLAPGAFPEAVRGNSRNIPLSALGELKKVLTPYGVTRIMRPFAQATGEALLTQVLRVEFSAHKSVDAMIEDISRVRGIEYAEKVPLMKTDATPNDPSFPPHLNQINATNAWNIFNGTSTVKVAIVDNAVMWNHADLLANTYSNTAETPGNNIDDDHNGYVDDIHGYNVADFDNDPAPTNTLMTHGTHCAGIAAAVTDNSVGVAAIGWNLRIIPVQCEADNSPSMTVVSSGYEGIVYAVKAGAQIISCSWGGSGTSVTEQNVVNYAWQRGCILMASAGNSAVTTPNYPGAYNNVYCVASVGSNDLKSGFSNYGTWVDICAPGNTIMSTVPYSGTLALYQQQSGTSMSTPLVAGLAGLMLSKSPQLTPSDVLNCISGSAVNIYSLSGNSTFTNQLGAGRIDAYQAMLCAASYSLANPVANFYAFPRQTCVGTAINFYDSSLYLPTSRSWTFQGGTPATSTLANPVVTYSATGTYSVAMSVSNGNGSHTTVKNSYITVVTPSSLPFAEGFQGTAFLPAGWTAKNIWNDNIYWQKRTGPGGFGNSNACIWFNNYVYYAPGELDEFRTPPINFTNVGLGRLRFDVAYARYDATFSDTLEVRASNNCGATWTTIYLKGGTSLATASDQSSQFTPSSSQWRRDTVDVSAFAGGNSSVIFSFINRGHYGQGIHIDNINIATPMPTINVAYSPTVCAGNAFTFTNTSLSAGSYTWVMPSSNLAVSNQLNPTVSYSAAGVYTFVVTAANGPSVTSVTRSITVLSNINITVNHASICSGASVVITPTGAATYSFYAPGGSLVANSSSYVASPSTSGIYTVTASNGGFCTSTKTLAINVTVTPVISAPSQTICPGGTATVTASGANTYSWSNAFTGSSFTAQPAANTVYTVTGFNALCSSTATTGITIGSALTVLVSGTAAVCAGGTATLTATGANNYTWTGGSQGASVVVTPAATTVYSVIGAAGSCTGSGQTTVSVTPLPVITIGSSTSGSVCAGTQVTLTANGAGNYVWSTTQTGAQLAVTPATTTTYSVTGDINGCSSSAMITVTVGNGNLPVNVSSMPAGSVCAGSQVTLTASGAGNYSWNSGQTGNVIVVTPTASSLYTVTGSNGACTGTASIFITTGSGAVTVNVSASATKICGAGSVTLTATGATGYQWSNGMNGPVIVVSPAATTIYTLTGTSGGCSGTSSISIDVSSGPAAALTTSAASCQNACNGIVMAQITGGTAPFSYSIGGNSVTLPAGGLCQGLHTLHITDALGCNSQNFFTIGASQNTLQATVTGTNASCGTCADGILIANAAGGMQPYSYTWSPAGGNSMSATGLTPGCYTVTIMDNGGCATYATACVGGSTGLEGLDQHAGFSMFPNPGSSFVRLEAQAEFSYCIYNHLGQLIATSNHTGNKTIVNVTGYAKGIYDVVIRISGTQITRKLVIE